MKKNFLAILFSWIMGVLILGACSSNPPLEDHPTQTEKQEVLPPHKIPKEKALRQLISVIESIPYNSLRSTQPHSDQVEYAKKLSPEDLIPISTEINLRNSSSRELERVLYLANFKDNKGYAVLAADDRIPDPILCIVDSGNISPDDFFSGWGSTTEEEIQKEVKDFKFYDKQKDDYWVAGVDPDFNIHRNIREYATSFMVYEYWHYGGGGSNPIEKPQEYTHKESDWVTAVQKEALLETKWNQGYPFNDFSPTRRKYFNLFGPKRKAYAGCVPIAIAQILTHLEPGIFKFNNITIDWKKVKKVCSYSNLDTQSITPEQRYMSAALLAHVGSGVDAWYTYSWTFAFPKNACKYLSEALQVNGEQKKYDFHLAQKMIDKNHPVFISGLSGIINGHAWVLDGYRILEKQTWDEDKNGNKQNLKTHTQELIHCNFGWKGLSDGYYASGIFNTKKGPEQIDKKDIATGSNRGDSNFKWFCDMIIYDL